MLHVESGDVIVTATDGVWDNVRLRDLTPILSAVDWHNLARLSSLALETDPSKAAGYSDSDDSEASDVDSSTESGYDTTSSLRSWRKVETALSEVATQIVQFVCTPGGWYYVPTCLHRGAPAGWH